MTRWLSEQEQRTWRGLMRVSTLLDAGLNRELQRSSGLSRSDYQVLVQLSETPDGRARAFEVGEELQWEQSRVSHHLARMQRRGLVAREDCPTDRRGAYVVLTAAGRAAIEKAAPAHVESVRRMVFDGLTPEQVANLGEAITAVLAQLDARVPPRHGRATAAPASRG
ncbi:MarR family winged helix-turn-helix transcriptional regulator [Actinokineospora bangkokensis]|uniref:MarR family transcriptional regulator n=1 Tax=Actinokineospora bangkokensis TaxID=1193682 RepID=A0A1Q9LK25_9PSEU|nr:MarR family transcriptional regulator [Actinokineospora bangkokensis]OLR92339.1 MarR family transcriptional regulator [Actinokineospora bangkokensis]